MHAKIYAVVLLVMLSLPGIAHAGSTPNRERFLENCQDDETVPAQTLVVACDNFISRTMRENHHIPLDGIALYFRAKAYARLGDYAKAQADAWSAVLWDPTGYAGYWIEFGEVSEKLGPPGKFAQALDMMLKRNPGNADFLNGACWARATRGLQLDVALSNCDESLQLKADDAPTLDSRCFVRFRMGQFATAIGDCDAALRLDPKMPSSLYVRGLADIRLGYPGPGAADIASAKAIDPGIADTYAGYGVTP